ncbi:aldehyde dehydrogenase family protein [Thermococcus sp. 21S7]|uniref:aldehyde dehydrogenase family protein n=1 Tax=Thermococcus sp. 21S7 TaxID=1638221 RepID=UPI00143B66F1|nr:aldehyde dehydrogenase family protein [Thermococcus sp. 21S7]NJE62071.1 aldehyde dehydrogenase family protein [Thermococcus sp. 21S7]
MPKDVLEELELSEVNSGVFYGEWMPTDGRELISSHSPIDGKEIAKVAIAGIEDYEAVIKKAQESFCVWSEIPAPERGQIIREIGDELRQKKEALARLVTLEVGKILTEGRGEVQEMIDIADFAVGLSRQLYGLTIASERKDHFLCERWHPLGPIGVITAFNFPCAVWSWNAFIAAAVGDVVVWKPSTKAPLTAIATTKIVNSVLERHGLPPIFFLVTGRGSTVGNWMAEDKRLPLISFTGSTATGRKVYEKVAKRIGRAILELGGNNAAIVSDKADMRIALKGVAFGALATAGQRCTTTRRLILHERIYGEFLDKLIKVYKGVKIGNPFEPDTLIGPLIDEEAVKKYEEAVERAVAEGGRILYGGKRLEGCYVMPTIIEAHPDMEVVREETFAPILYVFKYSTIEEALELNNSVPQGLSSAIFTNDLREAEYFLAHSDCGIANVNTSTAGAEIGGAFGGEKDTGVGREAGSDAWKFYARRQTATVNYSEDLPLAQGVKFDIE